MNTKIQGVKSWCRSNYVKISASLLLALTAIAPTAVLASSEEPILSSVVTSTMLQGVFDEIIGLLPVILPVIVGFIAIRKGISFVQSSLQGA